MDLINKKIKILTMKLSSLQDELKAVKDIANSASREVEALYDKKYKSEPKNKTKLPRHKKQENSEQLTEEISQTNVAQFSESAKKTFRRIALKLHPDKLLDLEDGLERDLKRQMYQKASDALESNDILALADIAIDLGVSPPKITDEDIEKAENKIKSIKKEINHIESTYVWKWLYCKNKQQKETLLKQIFNIIHDKKTK